MLLLAVSFMQPIMEHSFSRQVMIASFPTAVQLSIPKTAKLCVCLHLCYYCVIAFCVLIPLAVESTFRVEF